ncbi:MAG TPA: DotI/IcmL/TraM family protein, partial [Gammaproteobacteria bacterium]|nr:DotI/IcmL/TraM family protein [Gammaproteobacteria bacterium]
MQTTTEKPKHTDGLALIFLRQQFYLQQLQLVLAAVLVLCILISVLAGMLVYFIKHPVHPLYFSTDKLSRLMVEPPLNRPIMSPENVSKWVANAIESAYSYDFINYREQFQSSQQYFTDYGWKQYMKGLETSNNLEALNAHKMIVLAKVIAPPVLKTQGVMGGRFAY